MQSGVIIFPIAISNAVVVTLNPHGSKLPSLKISKHSHTCLQMIEHAGFLAQNITLQKKHFWNFFRYKAILTFWTSFDVEIVDYYL